MRNIYLIILKSYQWFRARYFYVGLQLTLYSIMKPLKYHVFENIMVNGAFAFLEQMLHFP